MKVSAKRMSLKLIKKEFIHPTICTFYFTKPEGFKFISGQYVQLIMSHDADDRGTTRFFSISSSPKEEYLLFTIKKGKSSFKGALFSLEDGSLVEAYGPMGHFTLEDSNT